MVSIGIGGSYLGAEFAYEALRTDADASKCAQGRRLRFLANVDPVGVTRALEGLNPETTLVIVISKTFTTAETMLNARTVREWISGALGEAAIPKHMVAVSASVKLVQECVLWLKSFHYGWWSSLTACVCRFGIDGNNVFEFWNWVGGTSASP